MAEWLYKATKTKVSKEKTKALLQDDGFICRSAYSKSCTRIPHTQAVAIGDIIHVYFTGDEAAPRLLGSWRVVAPELHKYYRRFVANVDQTALWSVDEGFSRRLRQLANPGYQPDPVVGEMVGWPVEPAGDAAQPPYSKDAFPSQMTLVKRP